MAEVALAAWIAAASLLAPQGSPPRPNIVLVLVDDLRFDGFSSTGNAVLRTDKVDAFAREGVVFENSFVTTSMCCPSRASLLTGRYAHETLVHDNRPEGDFQSRLPIFPELLQQAGYRTACFGKWHIPKPEGGPRSGFDRWVSFEEQGEYFHMTLNVDGVDVATRGHLGDVLTEYAVEWIEERGEEPFFALLALKNCHQPFVAPARHRGQLSAAAIALPPSFWDDPDGLPSSARRSRLSNRNRGAAANPSLYIESIRAYCELILGVDESVGRLREALERTGKLENTLFVITGDNGYMLGEHGLTQKQLSYEPSIRVPLIVRWSGVLPAGVRRSELVLNIDLTSTFLEAAGVAPPKQMCGRSLLELWRAGSAPWREDFLYLAPWIGARAPERELALRSHAWKYIRIRSLNGDQPAEEALFDLRGDPLERVNLASSEAGRAVLPTLRARMSELQSALRIPQSW
jgi:N-acetylglucosamine-6-sulfatase